jgi:hypothetical protein
MLYHSQRQLSRKALDRAVNIRELILPATAELNGSETVND